MHSCFFNYDEGEYRIAIPSAILPIVPNNNDRDSLQLAFNSVGTLCGNGIASYVESATATLVINEPDSLLFGNEHAITDFFYHYDYHKFLNSISTLVQLNMALDSINNTTVKEFYNNLLANYYATEEAPINIDIYEAIAEQMIESIFDEMRLEEAKIRSDINHRGSDNGIVYNVFNSYDVK